MGNAESSSAVSIVESKKSVKNLTVNELMEVMWEGFNVVENTLENTAAVDEMAVRDKISEIQKVILGHGLALGMQFSDAAGWMQAMKVSTLHSTVKKLGELLLKVLREKKTRDVFVNFITAMMQMYLMVYTFHLSRKEDANAQVYAACMREAAVLAQKAYTIVPTLLHYAQSTVSEVGGAYETARSQLKHDHRSIIQKLPTLDFDSVSTSSSSVSTSWLPSWSWTTWLMIVAAVVLVIVVSVVMLR